MHTLYAIRNTIVDPAKPEFLVPNIENTLKCAHIYMTVKNVKFIKVSQFFDIPEELCVIDYELTIELRKTYCTLCHLQNTTFEMVY